MFQSLNLEKLRHDTIKKLEKEKQDQEDIKKIQEHKKKYQDIMNINRFVKSKSHIQVKEQYFDTNLLEKEFEDFISHHQLFAKKNIIEEHIKDKNMNQNIHFIIRKEMKYLDEILDYYKIQLEK
tara:strand:- start:71 stop:442 length:372 start_codon:yes stop_codon:yes gene_type:complete